MLGMSHMVTLNNLCHSCEACGHIFLRSSLHFICVVHLSVHVCVQYGGGGWELSAFVVLSRQQIVRTQRSKICPLNWRTNEVGVLHCASNHPMEPDNL